MCMLTERTQVLLTPSQRARLERLAEQRGVSLGAVVREAIEAYNPRGGAPPEAALEALESLEAPVDEWDHMKHEILRGAHG